MSCPSSTFFADSAAAPALLGLLLLAALVHVEGFTLGSVRCVQSGRLQHLLHQLLKSLLHTIFCLGTSRRAVIIIEMRGSGYTDLSSMKSMEFLLANCSPSERVTILSLVYKKNHNFTK